MTGISSPSVAPPRAAAFAGVLFAVLMIIAMAIIRSAVPAHPVKDGTLLSDPMRRSALGLALSLTPFAGIAFLWFIAVVRDRFGALEDRFFATVLLGSGLLFVGALFSATVIAGAFVSTLSDPGPHPPSSETYQFARRATYAFVNIIAVKMAGVFTF